jgi:RNA polymerase sigma factor (sigma-70 family)
LEALLSVSSNPEQTAFARELISKLSEILSRRQFEIVIHYFAHEMTQNAIAELLGISERLVRTELVRIDQTIQRLRVSSDNVQPRVEKQTVSNPL